MKLEHLAHRILEKINQSDKTYLIAEEKGLLDTFDLEDYLLVDNVNLVHLEYLKILTYQSQLNYANQLIKDALQMIPGTEALGKIEYFLSCDTIEELKTHELYRLLPLTLRHQAKISYYANQFIENGYNYLSQQLALMDLTEYSMDFILDVIRGKQKACQVWEVYPGDDYVYASLISKD